jgi:dsRNA-specific ribonuclease
MTSQLKLKLSRRTWTQLFPILKMHSGIDLARPELLERALTHRSLTKQQASAQMLENGSNEADSRGG